MIGVGVIGLGVGMRHADAYARHPGCRLVGLCDLDAGKTSLAGERFPGVELTLDASRILDDPRIGLVSIASYDDAHFHQAMAALAAGKHIFVEKPVCQTREQALALAAELDRTGLSLSSNLVLRTVPRFRKFREDIRAGLLGEVFYIEADYLWGRAEKMIHGWRGAMEYYSIIQGAAVHMIDLAVWLTGELPVEVQALGSHLATQGAARGADDLAVLLLRFESGLIVKAGAVAACVHPHFHRLSVFGASGSFIHEHSGSRLFTNASPSAAPDEVLSEYPGKEKGEAAASFVDSVLSARPPLVSAKDVFDVMDICFAAQRALKDRQTVRIDYHYHPRPEAGMDAPSGS